MCLSSQLWLVAEAGDVVVCCNITYQFTTMHEVGHPSLVRWQQPKEKDEEEDSDTTADALQGLDERLQTLEKRFEDQSSMYAERLMALETKVEERFQKLEDLLQLIVSKKQ
jgi:hypothetical protein